MTLAMAIAGGFGAVARHLAMSAMQRLSHRSWPSGTVIVNLIGSVAVGVVVGWSGSSTSSAVGFLAGFTTYSAWMVESVWLWGSGPGGHGRAVLDLVGSLVAGATLAWIGLLIGRVV